MVAANSSVTEVINWFVLVLMILSIVGAFCTVFTFAIFKKLRTYPIKLIMYLCVCIVCGFTAFLIAFEPWVAAHDPCCIIIAIFVHYFFLANFLWTFCVAFNFYQMIVRRNRSAQSLEKFYHILAWGIPAIFVLFTGAFDQYGDLGGACYIKYALTRFLTFFIPGLVIITCNAILFFFIAREIHETLSTAPKTDAESFSHKRKEFRVYLSIFISIGLSWIFGYLLFLLPFPIVTDIFYILFSIFTPMQGILIFIFYIINKKVAARYAGLFAKCLPCCAAIQQRLDDTHSTSRSHSASSKSNRSSNSSSMSSSRTL